MKILFICKYNVFRSRIAEEYFNKINKNRNIKVISRGLIMGEAPAKAHVKVSKELLNVNILSRKPLPLKIQDIQKADLVIVTANDIPSIIFNHHSIKSAKKIIFWKIKDEQLGNERNIKHIILGIKRKVDKLNASLTNKK